MPDEAARRPGFWAALRGRRKRGGLELGVVALVGLLIAGVVAGTGLSQTVLETADPLTWLANIRGELTLVNPETGTPVERLQVAQEGEFVHVSQGPGGVLVVTNLATNEVTIIDTSLLQVVGSRQGNEGVKVILADRRIYLVDKVAGLIELLDPLTAATVGQWQAGAPLADAAVDGRGAVSALDQAGNLVTLALTNDSFVEQERRRLPQADAAAVLVGHERGVTAANPGGSVSQVGTGSDRTLTAAGLAAPLVVPDHSPARLVPVSSPESSSLHLVRDSRVLGVAGGSIGCREPGKAAVYRGRIYVPCLGEGRVVVLDAEGSRAEPDLAVPGDAELVLNAGLLIINVPDAETGWVIKPDGTRQEIRTHDPSVPRHDPAARPDRLPPDLAQPPTAPAEQPADDNRPGDPDEPGPAPDAGGPARPIRPVIPGPGGGPGDPIGPGGQGGPGDPIGPGGGGTGPPDPGVTDPPSPTPTPPAPTESPPPNLADYTPQGVPNAVGGANGTVQLTWNAPLNAPDEYRFLRADTGEQVGSPIGGAATEATLNGLPVGQSLSFIVVAVSSVCECESAPSTSTSSFGQPAAPTVGVQMTARSPATLTLQVNVDVVAGGDGGNQVTAYNLTVTSSTGRTLETAVGVSIADNRRQVRVDCQGLNDLCMSGGSVTATATLHNGAGDGQPGSTTAGIDPPPNFAFNGSVMIVSTGGKCLDADLALHTCTGSSGQFWSIRGTGDIQNPSRGQCLSGNGTLHFTNDGCSGPGGGADEENRWDLRASGGNNTKIIQHQDDGGCIFANGDVAGEGVPVRNRGCQFNDQERWTFFTASLPLVPASFTPPADDPARDGALGGVMTGLLLLVLAATALRPRARRR